MIGVVVRGERIVAVEETPDAKLEFPVRGILSSAIRETDLQIDAGPMRCVGDGGRA